MSLDLDPFGTPANTATSLGTREPCAIVAENDLLDADEDAPDQLNLDLTASSIPADDAISGYTAQITYPMTGVQVVASDNAGLLSTAPGYTPLSSSDAVPDTNGVFQIDERDLNNGGASGSGFLTRLTIETRMGATPGLYALTLGQNTYIDVNGSSWRPVTNSASLVIGPNPWPDPCTDFDGDGVPNTTDNCPVAANPGQEDRDLDLIGNVCDADNDNDTLTDPSDNCPLYPNPGQQNNDGDALGDACDPDDDNDGVSDAQDNCDFIANPGQENHDSDRLGDACDSDDDNDWVYDTDEAGCGSDPLLASRRPERIDGVFSGVSDDGDAEVDEPLPPGSEAFDCDGDGYLGSEENNVYQPSTRGDQDACGTNSSPPTVPASPIGWPADLSPASPNAITLADVTSFVAPVKYFNTNVGTNPGDVRWDLKTGKGSFAADINLNDLTGLTVRKPPMLGGVRAFNGPACPWAP